jgi:hypothetical protein
MLGVDCVVTDGANYNDAHKSAFIRDRDDVSIAVPQSSPVNL